MVDNNPYKQLLHDILTMFRYKVDNGECTPEEMRCYCEGIVKNLTVNATLDDIANAFSQNKNNVKAVMNRNQFQKNNPPKTKKFYDFIKFSNIIPSSWRERRTTKDNE